MPKAFLARMGDWLISTETTLANAERPELRHYLELWMLRAVVFILQPLSIDIASWLMGKIWRVAMTRGRRHRRALANLALALPEKSEAERRRIAAGMEENFGRVFIEVFRLAELQAHPERFDVAGAELVTHLANGGGGLVLASLHQGNWEANACALNALGVKPAGVYRQLSNPLVEDIMFKVRSAVYPAGLYCRRPRGNIARQLLQLVKAGGTLAVLSDLKDDSGVFLDFFGAPTSTNSFAAFVARMTGAPLIAAGSIRTHGVNFRGQIELVPVPHTDDRNADIEVATKRLAAVFERWIRAHPDQWLWTHRKWRLSDEEEALVGRTKD
ncbi:MAG: hypothetical protein P4L82_11585 [Ancalomicrobiaceae bacterium]|nr:hypothetical protein [Ancalomicrobiaceae bacterium]